MGLLDKFLRELIPYTEALDVKDELLIYQYATSKTKRIRVEKVISDNEFEFPWSDATTYDKYDIVSYNGDLWEAVLSGNTGNAPVEGQWWTKLNKVVGSTITEWKAGAYGKGIVVVHFPYAGGIAAYAGVKLWELVVPELERPFLSADITTEIDALKWVPVHPVGDGSPPDLTPYVSKTNASTEIELTPSTPSKWGTLLTEGKATLIAFINYIGTRIGQVGDKDVDVTSRVDQRVLKYDSAQNKYVHVAANDHSHSADDITETDKLFISQAERDKLSKLSPTYESPVQTTVELTALPQAQLIDRERRFVEDAKHDFFYNAQAATQDEGYLPPDDQTGGLGYWVPLPTGGSETALSIAQKYHSNSNTEQFETLEKQKLAGIATEATKNVKVTDVDAAGVDNDVDFLTVAKALVMLAARVGNGVKWDDINKKIELGDLNKDTVINANGHTQHLINSGGFVIHDSDDLNYFNGASLFLRDWKAFMYGADGVEFASGLGSFIADNFTSYSFKGYLTGEFEVDTSWLTLFGDFVHIGKTSSIRPFFIKMEQGEGGDTHFVDIGVGWNDGVQKELKLQITKAGGITIEGELPAANNPNQILRRSEIDALIAVIISGAGNGLFLPVSNIAGLKAIDTTDEEVYPDKWIINVEDAGLYRLDRDSSAAGDDNLIVEPTAGVGRWLKLSSQLTSHALLSALQGGTTGEYYHLTAAKYAIANSAELAFTNAIKAVIDANEAALPNKLNIADLPSDDLVIGNATIVAGTLDVTDLDIANLTLTANSTIASVTGLKAGGTILNITPAGFTLAWSESLINPLNIEGDVFDVDEEMIANILCTSESPLRFKLSYDVNYAPVIPPPAAPSGLTATAINSGRIDLAWTDNSSDETGFQIESSTDNVSFALVEEVGAGETTYQDVSVNPETLYYYRVTAVNANGNSAYSNTASDATPAVEDVWFEVNLGGSSDPAIANNLSGRLSGSSISDISASDGTPSGYDVAITTTFDSVYSGGSSPTYITGNDSGDESDLALGSAIGQGDTAAVITISGLPIGSNIEVQAISCHINSAARTMFGLNGGTQLEVNSYQNITYNAIGTAAEDGSGNTTIEVNRKSGVAPVGIINVLRFRVV